MTLTVLINRYEELEIKQENGTITMEEDALRIKICQRLDDLLYS